jgi:histone H4
MADKVEFGEDKPDTHARKSGKILPQKAPVRHGKKLKDNIQGITAPAIRRMARRAGVKRISGTVYEDQRERIKNLITMVMRTAIVYTQHARRKTVTPMDIVLGLKRVGTNLYGFGY